MDPPSDHINSFLFHERAMSNLGQSEPDEEEEEVLYRQQAGKKRRLAAGQVEYLEKSFEVENKLEPERKNRLAMELGLQPRQVAIWFQNRRARYKTKQLEKDYDLLKSNFDSLKSDYGCLVKQNEVLQNEGCGNRASKPDLSEILGMLLLLLLVIGAIRNIFSFFRGTDAYIWPPNPLSAVYWVSMLTNKLKQREEGDPDSVVRNERAEEAPVKETKEAEAEAGVMFVACKQEEASSAKSDVSDSESPQCTESRGFEHEEAEDLTGSFLPVPDYGFGRAEEGDFHGGSCSGLGLPGLDGQPSYWPWLY